MFEIPQETLAYWARRGYQPATEAEIAEASAVWGAPPPDDYRDFLRQFGFVNWDVDTPDTFDYRIREGGNLVEREQSITHVQNLEGLRRMRKFGWSDEPDNGLPVAPEHMFPAAETAGHDLILLDLNDGSVWFLPEGREDPWGTGDNTELGRVADSFTAFVNGLRLGEE